MVKISVIIPVYNVEEYLRQCLDSVVNQTLQEIEVICVNDASTDGSLHILEEFKSRDNRIQIINYDRNYSASQARKDGVYKAQGKYIIFMDADDYWEPQMCEHLYEEMESKQVDIIHFNSVVENCNNLTQERIDSNQRHIAPYLGELKGREVFEGCFLEKKYSYTLWNKIFKTSLCKKAFEHVKDGVFPKAQDLYAYFIIAYFAESYCGIDTPAYYHYCFGRGITGHNVFDCKMLERFCTQAYVATEIKNFIAEQNEDEVVKGFVNELEDKLMLECINSWRYRMPETISSEGFDILLKYWDKEKVVLKVSSFYWKNRLGLLNKIGNSNAVHINKEVKTIATYYYHVVNGGVQKVISQLIPMWKEMGYKVVLITDTERHKDDYDIPDDVERVVIPHYTTVNADNFVDRANAWKEVVEKYNIDTVVYHAWLSDLLLWDMLYLKSKNVSFVVNTHSVFSMPLISMPLKFNELPKLYSLCDAIVSLSETDRNYWGHFVKRAFYMPNPLPYNLEEIETSELKEVNLLWVGRISKEKRVFDTLKITSEVVKSFPNAKLTIVGSAVNELEMKQCKKEVEKLGIVENVDFAGFHKDVSEFYKQATILIMTSEYEGFPLVLAESKLYGVPTVMYELPYLQLVKDTKGIVSVAQGDIQSAAYEICRLIADKNRLQELGKEARTGIEPFINYDLKGKWNEVFESLNEKIVNENVASDDISVLMMKSLLHYLHSGNLKRVRENIAKQNKVVKDRNVEIISQDDALVELNIIKGTWSYRIGRWITYIPRKVRGGIWCYQEHGMNYTVNRMKVKLKRIFDRIGF